MRPEYRVILGMSGGVDSSVAGLLLKQSGYEVQGVLLRTWRTDQKPDILNDAEKDAFESAQKTAESIDIPFMMVDVREAFQNIVIAYFKEAYSNGLTPNPCMICNRDVKWASLLGIADQMDAKWIATGHYARLLPADGQVKLLKGRDPRKDQTYFLSHLPQKILQRTLFPLGSYTKDEIRSIARENHIEAVNRPESQDLCFLEGSDYRSFMLSCQPDAFTPGEIVDLSGNVIGKHNGLANYTIGQRKGLGIYRSQPMYVVQKDVRKNRLIAGFEDQMGTQQFIVRQVNWINGLPSNGAFQVQLKIRYQARLVDAVISPAGDDRFVITPGVILRDVTPGQFAVFYDGETVLGGGTISTDMQSKVL